jgi:glutaminyl-tRNA synthetase
LLKSVIFLKAKNHFNITEPFDKVVSVLIYQLATKFKAQLKNRLNFLIENIVSKNLNTEPQLTGKNFLLFNQNHQMSLFFRIAAFEYLLSNPNDPLNVAAFNEFCGVGVVVTLEQIKSTVNEVLNAHKNDLIEKRYKFNVGLLMSNFLLNI